MKDTVLVTGGAGFIGSNVVRALEARGKRVVICDRLRDGEKWRNLGKRRPAEILMPGDLQKYLERNSAEIEAVVHMGAVSSPGEKDADRVVHTNLTFSQHLWMWLEQLQIPFVYASSAGAYGDGAHGFSDDPDNLRNLQPQTAYAWSKHLFDLWAMEQAGAGDSPPHWTGLKFFNVYGPHEWHKVDPSPITRWLMEEEIKVFEAGPKNQGRIMARDFVYIDDVVDVVLWALEGGGCGEILNVGAGDAYTWQAAADIFGTAWQSTHGGKLLETSYEDLPEEMLERYQWITEADLTRLRAAGYDGPFRGLKAGVESYLWALDDGGRYR